MDLAKMASAITERIAYRKELIAKIDTSTAENFQQNFEWGYLEKKYQEELEIKLLEHIFGIISKEDASNEDKEKEVQKQYVKICAGILNADQEFTSNRAKNISYELKIAAKKSIYNFLTEFVTED